MKCIRCNSDAFYKRPYEGTALCRGCFREDIEDKVRKTISRHHMLSHNDHIAVGVSGGKDSLALLTILKKIEHRFPQARMTAISVDEGIEGYRAEAIGLASERCSELGVGHHVVSFKELFGRTLNGIVSMKNELAPCSYCGVLRRRALNVAASKIKATKIATAHTLDDEAQTLLLNIFHGGVERIARVAPYSEDPGRRFLPRIKPASEILERELCLYAYLSGIKFQTTPCPYLASALRNDVRHMLNRMEAKHPGSKFVVLRSFERIRSSMKPGLKEFTMLSCSRCGEPSAESLCRVCRMLDEPAGI